MIINQYEFRRFWHGFAVVREHHNGPGMTFGYWPRKSWAVYCIKRQPFFR